MKKYDLKEKANDLLKMYSSDLDLTFPEECRYLRAFLEENRKLYKEKKS